MIKTRVDDPSAKDKDYLHKIGNDFVQEVCTVLKLHYPCRINAISVDLTCKAGKLTLTYHAWFVACAVGDADWHFDHRGALAAKPGLKAAQADAQKRALDQKPKSQNYFQTNFGKVRIDERSDYAVLIYNGSFYAIDEYFFASPKTKKD